MSTQSTQRILLSAIAASILVVACGKKGPPLPPLVRLPAAPTEFTAARRGDHVVLQFIVPSANTDNTRPANVSRVDVYGVTAPATIADDQLVTFGTKVGSVAVKSPRDPNQTVDPDESSADMEPPRGEGLDQGSHAQVEEQLTSAALLPVQVPASAADLRRAVAEAAAGGPLLGMIAGLGTPSRTYAGVSVDTRGRRGPMSKRVTVPLLVAPPAPSSPTVDYNETSITVTWTAAAIADAAGLLPSHVPGVAAPALAYHVYEVVPPAAAPSTVVPSPTSSETRLTGTPVAETKYADTRVTWGAQRCYGVRAIATMGALSVESEERPATCVTLTDTFPPAPPKGLRGVASEGSISLIWDPNGEKDLAGYLVLRGAAPAATLEPITPAAIQATTFNDTVAPGVRYVYAIVAIDSAGNRSAPSETFEDAAR